MHLKPTAGFQILMTGMTLHEIITGSILCACSEVHPRFFFLAIVVIQNVALLMTESSMATGCDVTESDVTGSDVIRPNVGDSHYYYSKKKKARMYFRACA
jgi:hypothetical protein